MVAELRLRITPRAGADGVGPYLGGTLHVRVTRPPADGEANRAVQRLVAKALGLPPSALSLVIGARSRVKRYQVAGISSADLEARLAALGA